MKVTDGSSVHRTEVRLNVTSQFLCRLRSVVRPSSNVGMIRGVENGVGGFSDIVIRVPKTSSPLIVCV